MTEQVAEPELPVTPTNEGRRPRISNFGYNVPYKDLWPMLVGLCGTMLAGLAFGSQVIPAHWAVAVFFTILPIAFAHLYVKMFVEDALPHTQQDTIARIVSLTPDFNAPVSRRFPLLPRFRPALSMAADPQADDGLHPLMRLRGEYAKTTAKNKGAR